MFPRFMLAPNQCSLSLDPEIVFEFDRVIEDIKSVLSGRTNQCVASAGPRVRESDTLNLLPDVGSAY